MVVAAGCVVDEAVVRREEGCEVEVRLVGDAAVGLVLYGVVSCSFDSSCCFCCVRCAEAVLVVA